MSSMVKVFKNVRILPGTWRNFSGTVGEYNAPIGVDSEGKPIGKRYFSIELTPEMAEELRNVELRGENGNVIKGCNIKTRIPDEEMLEPMYSMRITFGKIAPEVIWRVIPKGKELLTLETVGNLDHEYIEKADVKVVLSTYEKGPNKGITAYLNKLRVYIREDEFDTDPDFINLPMIGRDYDGSSPMSDEDDLPF